MHTLLLYLVRNIICVEHSAQKNTFLEYENILLLKLVIENLINTIKMCVKKSYYSIFILKFISYNS